MAKTVHRQPIWGVVLLSTLLLSPFAAATVRHALMQEALAPVGTAPVGESNAPVAPLPDGDTALPDSDTTQPRRSEEGLSGVRGLFAARRATDTHPDHPAIVAVYARQASCLVPDAAPLALRPAPDHLPANAPRSAAPRAPPA